MTGIIYDGVPTYYTTEPRYRRPFQLVLCNYILWCSHNKKNHLVNDFSLSEHNCKHQMVPGLSSSNFAPLSILKTQVLKWFTNKKEMPAYFNSSRYSTYQAKCYSGSFPENTGIKFSREAAPKRWDDWPQGTRLPLAEQSLCSRHHRDPLAQIPLFNSCERWQERVSTTILSG